MTIINRKRHFIYLKSRKTASSSVEIFLITKTSLGNDCYSTSREILSLGLPRAVRNQPLVPGLTTAWYTPGRRESQFKARVRGASRLHPSIKQHESAKRVRSIIGRRRFRESTIAVNVRNPWDALVSYYRWEISGGLGRWKRKQERWDDWLYKKLYPAQDIDGLSQAQKWLFHDFLFIDDAFIKPYFIRFESIDESLQQLATAVSISIPNFTEANLQFKKFPESKRVDYRSFYSNHQAQLVADTFKEYLHLTGYQF